MNQRYLWACVVILSGGFVIISVDLIFNIQDTSLAYNSSISENSQPEESQLSAQKLGWHIVIIGVNTLYTPNYNKGKSVTKTYYGVASYYSNSFRGRRMANGQRYNPNASTAAHRSLPFGTRVRVTNMLNGRSVIVKITDRGPFVPGRIIDLSFSAASSLGIVGRGVAPVRVEVLGK